MIVLVRIAKIIDDAVWENPEAVGPGRELFWPRALKLRPERQDGEPVPVRVDHVKDGSEDIGRVTALSEVKDLDGRWVIAHCDVDKAPDWLHRETAASMTWCNLGPREPMPGGWTLHISGMVSLLSPSKQPAEPGAKVWHIQRSDPAPSPADRPSSPGRAAGEVVPIASARTAVTRRGPSDAEQDAELRRRLDWAEAHGLRADFELILENLLLRSLKPYRESTDRSPESQAGPDRSRKRRFPSVPQSPLL